MKIIGAGLAGLLAASMLRRFRPTILERQPSLPNNHDALLRFRSDAVARATGTPFQKVVVQKMAWMRGTYYNQPSLQINNMYSEKVTGSVLSRSILKLDPVERWIAPRNFISLLGQNADIQFSCPILKIEKQEDPVISTMPMPSLMELVGWPRVPSFQFRTIHTITCDIQAPETDVHQTIYYPDPRDIPYRASITGNRLMVEIMGETCAEDSPFLQQQVDQALQHFGFSYAHTSPPHLSSQKYGKITPIRTEDRKEFILAMTDLYNIYSLGRFATWRQILLDDVVQDVGIIDRFVSERDSYSRKLSATVGNHFQYQQ